VVGGFLIGRRASGPGSHPPLQFAPSAAPRSALYMMCLRANGLASSFCEPLGKYIIFVCKTWFATVPEWKSTRRGSLPLFGVEWTTVGKKERRQDIFDDQVVPPTSS